MTTITLPATTSPLVNTLLRVVTGENIPWDVAAAAADLIAVGLQFNNWFLTVAKPQATEEEFDRLLEQAEESTTRIEQCWAAYESTGHQDATALRNAIHDVSRNFRAVIEGKPDSSK